MPCGVADRLDARDECGVECGVADDERDDDDGVRLQPEEPGEAYGSERREARRIASSSASSDE